MYIFLKRGAFECILQNNELSSIPVYVTLVLGYKKYSTSTN